MTCFLPLSPQAFGTVGLMGNHMTGTEFSVSFQAEFCQVQFKLADGINAFILLTFIPLLDLVIMPLLQNCSPSILKRLGLGTMLALASLLALCLMEGVGSHHAGREGKEVCMFDVDSVEEEQLKINIYWILLPIVTVTLAEVFIYIPSKRM